MEVRSTGPRKGLVERGDCEYIYKAGPLFKEASLDGTRSYGPKLTTLRSITGWKFRPCWGLLGLDNGSNHVVEVISGFSANSYLGMTPCDRCVLCHAYWAQFGDELEAVNVLLLEATWERAAYTLVSEIFKNKNLHLPRILSANE